MENYNTPFSLVLILTLLSLTVISALRTFNLSQNKLISIPEALSCLTSLKQLFLSYFPFSLSLWLTIYRGNNLTTLPVDLSNLLDVTLSLQCFPPPSHSKLPQSTCTILHYLSNTCRDNPDLITLPSSFAPIPKMWDQADCILPGLFLGGLKASSSLPLPLPPTLFSSYFPIVTFLTKSNLKGLKARGITHILQLIEAPIPFPTVILTSLSLHVFATFLGYFLIRLSVYLRRSLLIGNFHLKMDTTSPFWLILLRSLSG